jgi:hypothetical protein
VSAPRLWRSLKVRPGAGAEADGSCWRRGGGAQGLLSPARLPEPHLPGAAAILPGKSWSWRSAGSTGRRLAP